MKRQFVYDPLISKRQQYLLATQVRTLLFPALCIKFILMICFYVPRAACAGGPQNRCVIYLRGMKLLLTARFRFSPSDDVIIAGQDQE